MNSRLWMVLFFSLFGVGIAFAASTDFERLFVRSPGAPNEFVVSEAEERSGLGKEWVMVIRYSQAEWSPQISGFDIILSKSVKGNECLIAFFEPGVSSGRGFKEMTPDGRIAVATKIRRIEKGLASRIYETWVDALLKTKYAEYNHAADGNEYYISAFSLNLGFLCGRAGAGFSPRSHVGQIVKIGKLLRRYVDSDDKDAARIGSEILTELKEAGEKGQSAEIDPPPPTPQR